MDKFSALVGVATALGVAAVLGFLVTSCTELTKAGYLKDQAVQTACINSGGAWVYYNCVHSREAQAQ